MPIKKKKMPSIFNTRPREKDQQGTKQATGSTAGSATEEDQAQYSQAADQVSCK